MTDRGPGSILCPVCRKLISRDESRCPHCGARTGGEVGARLFSPRLFGDRLNVVVLIPALCVICYLFSLARDPGAVLQPTGGFFNLLSPSGSALLMMGMTYRVDAGTAPWWTLFTAIYLHGGLLHIFFNILWIRQLGPAVADAFGPARYFVIFTLAGAGGFVASNLFSGAPTVGASGAVFGLLGALIVYGRRTGRGMLTQQLWQWAIALFVLGFLMARVNNYAHAGGFLVGLAAGRVMGVRGSVAEDRTTIIAALVCLALTAIGFIHVAWRLLGDLTG